MTESVQLLLTPTTTLPPTSHQISTLLPISLPTIPQLPTSKRSWFEKSSKSPVTHLWHLHRPFIPFSLSNHFSCQRLSLGCNVSCTRITLKACSQSMASSNTSIIIVTPSGIVTDAQYSRHHLDALSAKCAAIIQPKKCASWSQRQYLVDPLIESSERSVRILIQAMHPLQTLILNKISLLCLKRSQLCPSSLFPPLTLLQRTIPFTATSIVSP